MKSLLNILVIALLVFVVLASFLRYGIGTSLNYSLADSALSVSIFALLSSGLKYQVKFIKFEGSSFFLFILSHLSAALIISSMWVFTVSFILNALNIQWGNAFLIGKVGYSFRLTVGVMGYFIVTAFNYLFLFYDANLEKLKSETELKALISEAELKSLKFQINPHFIFNSLNSLSALTLIDPIRANKMTIELAAYLRATLSDDNKKMKKVGEEIENGRHYVEIEKIRFEDKFIYSEEVDPRSLDENVPNMILQPLLENAIKYGVYETLVKTEIKMKCRYESNYCIISVENKIEENLAAMPGEKIGLKNISERLRLIYHQDDLLKVSRSNGFFTVFVYIPTDFSNILQRTDDAEKNSYNH